jgi:SlyX protein
MLGYKSRIPQGPLAELVDASDLKSLAFGRAGSIPAGATKAWDAIGKSGAERFAAMEEGSGMTDEAWGDEVSRRLVALESRLSHHEVMAEELSEVVARQGRTIDDLTTEIRRLRLRLAAAEAGYTASQQDEKPPPHY